MRKLAITTTALLGAFFSSAAQAEDIISRFTVRDQGQFAVDGSLAGSRGHSSYGSPYAPGLSAEQHDYDSRAILGGNIGLGYGIELYAALPYVLSNHVGVDYTYQGNHFSRDFDGDKGFSDATFGLKYRAFKSADGSNEVLLRAAVLHHSGSSGFISAEASYLHMFAPAIKTAISLNYEKVQGGPDSAGMGTYLMWQVSPQIAFVPYVRADRISGYQGLASYSAVAGGVQLRYSPVKGWNITPGLSGSHAGKRGSYIGSSNSIGASLIVQKEF
ncbi:hypothetical protein [Collimonas sp.]|jgi:hypothetical protein|uniref:hypothetical protein n=1 Tax=Collimonas sp. TaxID=1963772 RepID=UPI002CC3D931|nr:hypothetical protein [Collimonas sp.]HWX00540.1 hypothetical protein [Collimonas sp.]